MSTFLCWVTLNCVTTSLANSTLNDLFNAFTGWVLAAVQWLLTAVGATLNATSDPLTIVQAAQHEFTALLPLAPWLLLLGVLVATLSCIRHGDHVGLWRLYLGVAPACVAAIFLAQPVALDILRLVDALCSVASSQNTITFSQLADSLTKIGIIPGFGVFLLASLVTVAAVLLWAELLLRSVALSLLLVLVPLVIPLSTFPGLRRVGWRLLETFVALAGSKVIVVATLALGLSELNTADASAVLMGVVTLLLACATPFIILRLVPVMEQSAVHALEGLRHRAVRSAVTSPQSPVGLAVQALWPDAPVPGPPAPSEDLGFPLWEGHGDLPLPPLDGEPPDPPLGESSLRHGRVAYFKDKWGPVIGWHWDD
jgi:hypothetical protein